MNTNDYRKQARVLMDLYLEGHRASRETLIASTDQTWSLYAEKLEDILMLAVAPVSPIDVNGQALQGLATLVLAELTVRKLAAEDMEK